MGRNVSDYVFATVAYGDVFEYPLTGDDLYFWCIKKVPRKNIRTMKIPGVARRDCLFTLRGREHIIDSYAQRPSISRRKREVARSAARWLRFIPSLTLVGITGGLAVNNVTVDDDIDLFCITASHTLWITRALTTMLIDMLGIRRRPGDREVSNKICLNMFMSEDALAIPKKEQDLFSAHEVLQMEPLWARGRSYRDFLEKNSWVAALLPIAWNVKRTGRNNHPKSSYIWTSISVFFLRWLEFPARVIQLWYMRRRRTREVITPKMLRFHPEDARRWVKREFEKRLSKRNIPLDNIFYAD
jgi:hypothetical protein